MGRISRNQIESELRQLGLDDGDVVFVSSDLMRVGYFNTDAQTTMRDWLDILLNCVGSSGTVVVPTYSPSNLRYIQKSDFVFTRGSASESGSLATAILSFGKDAVRGAHPTCSCTAIGPLAQDIAGDHDVGASAYDPYGKIIEHNGKNLMLGTVDTKNCPMPFHYAQQVLGHTRTHPLSGLLETKYEADSGGTATYIVREIGGCTRGVHNCWGYILARNGVSFGQVGKSTSALVDTRKAFEVFSKVLADTPSVIRCTNKNCISCYGRYRYNGMGVFLFYVRKPFSILRKCLISRVKKVDLPSRACRK